MIKVEKICQALFYLIKNNGSASKMKLVKLMYLADKYHALLYGRTITNDDYKAMKFGPVGVGTLENVCKAEKEPHNLDLLSKTDLEALDYIISNFGNKTDLQLTEIICRYPEWCQYSDFFKTSPNAYQDLKVDEIVSIIDESDCLYVSPEHIKMSQEIISGSL